MKTVGFRWKNFFVCVTIFAVAAAALTAVGCTGSQATAEADKHLVLNCSFDYMKVGESRRYYIKKYPAQAGYETVWESLDENVAIVDEKGEVTALSGGETTITVSAKNTPYKAAMKLTVADETVDPEAGINALQEAVDNVKNDGYVLIKGGYYPSLIVSKRVSVTGAEGARIGDVKIKDGGALYLYSTEIYAASGSGSEACVNMNENAEFTAVGCSFLYDREEKEPPSDTALLSPSDAVRVYLRACSFSGYSTCVKIGATEGEIRIVNNDFSDADVAVEIDMRDSVTEKNKEPFGVVADNVYLGCDDCVKLCYYASSYTGRLETDDADVSVPS